MNEPHGNGTRHIYPQLDNALQCRPSKIKEIEVFFIAEINDRDLNKHITAISYADRTLVVLSGESSSFSLCSFATDVDAPIGIASAGISLVFLPGNGILKMYLKTMGIKKVKTQKSSFAG